MFHNFAAVYDRLMGRTDYGKWTDFIEAIFKAQGHKPRTIVDLACGTGTITGMLARRGYSVTGIDLSEEMLEAAREKLRLQGIRIPLVQGDMRSFSLHKPAEAVVCLCDGFNYLLSESDLAKALQCIHRNLVPGGLLVFDVSSAYKLQSVLSNKVMAEVQEAVTLIWQNHYEPRERQLSMDLTFFVKEGSLYRRFEETHIQRAYDAEDLIRILSENGYEGIVSYGPFALKPPGNRDHRLFFAAKRDFL